MFYSGNDNYMQDLYFYNQMPNQNTYNPMGMNNNGNIPNTMMNNGMYMNQGQNPNMYMQNSNQPANINTLYPSSYRILMPVVSRVVSNSNYQFLNEDVLDNMVDTVYNITEGQINYENENDQVTTRERTSNTQTNSTSVSQTNQNSSNSNTTNVTNSTTRVNNNTTQTSNNNSTNTSNDNLLRDLIKILIIREIISRRQFPKSNMSNNVNMYNMNTMNNPNMNPYCNM